MAIEDDVLTLQQQVAQLIQDRDNLVQSDSNQEDRIQALEQVRDDLTPRVNTLEEDRRSITRDSLTTPLYFPFYAAGAVVDVEHYLIVHVPNDYGALVLRASPDREYNGYQFFLDLGTPIANGLTMQDSSGITAIAASAFSAAGVYAIRRINGAWKTAKISGNFVNA